MFSAAQVRVRRAVSRARQWREHKGSAMPVQISPKVTTVKTLGRKMESQKTRRLGEGSFQRRCQFVHVAGVVVHLAGAAARIVGNFSR